MILDKEVEIAINPVNINKFEQQGYNIPKYYNENKKKYVVKRGTKIKVKVVDLALTSQTLVNVACDYCFKEKILNYRDYIKSLNCNEHVRKYCCEDCDHLKKQEIYEYKQKYELLKNGDKGYWNFKENRLKELDNYIKKYGTISGMQNNKNGAIISSTIREKGDNLEECCLELGYDLKDIIKNYKPKDYYKDFDNLKNEIQKLIETLGRFPMQKEVLVHLHISNNILLSFGGIKEIKRKMEYNDISDLIDDNGFRNLSAYEYMTAQYLIENSISYKREQHPFKGKYKNFRSDFTFYLSDKEIHVEVWGFSRKDDKSKRSMNYNKKRITKEKLYENYNYTLIGIDYEVFIGKYDAVQERLYNIFKPFLKLKFKFVNQEKFIPFNRLSDEELLNEILKYSDNLEKLPKQSTLQENGKSYLYIEALNRYGTYYNFAKKFKKYTHYKMEEWNKDVIFETFDYMITKYGHILSGNKIRYSKDEFIKGIEVGSQKVFGSMLDAKLLYFEYLVDNGLKITESDLKYIDDAINIRRGFNRKYLNEEKILRFKNLIYNYNQK